MKSQTINAGGKISPWISTSAGNVLVGESGRARKLVHVPIPDGARWRTPERQQWRTLGVWTSESGAKHSGSQTISSAAEVTCAASQGVQVAESTATPGQIESVPGRDSPEGAVLILIRDQSGFRGSWSLTDRSGLMLIATGQRAQGDAGRMGGGPEFLAVVTAGGQAVTNRTGRLYGEPAKLTIKNFGGEISVEAVD